MIVYIWTEELYKKQAALPLCSWSYPLIPEPGDILTVSGEPQIIGEVRKIFESVGKELIINVIVRWKD